MMALTTVLLLLSQLLLISSQVEEQDSNPMAEAEFLDGLGYNHVQQKLRRDPRLRRGKRPKNIILFIGDGMGIATVTSYRIAKNQKLQSPYVQLPVYFETFPYSGLLKTHSYDHHVTDSAASAVALLNGRKVDSMTLGMKPGLSVICTTSPEDHIEGIADLAIEKGLAVGSVTNTRITHATPAALFAKGVHRLFEYDEEELIESGATCRNDIAAQLLNYPAANFQVIMGGGANRLMDSSRGGKRRDGLNVDLEWEKLGGKRKILRTGKDLREYNASRGEKVLGIFAPSHIPYVVDRNNSPVVPELYEMTAKAIEILRHHDKGYFLLVEGGNIDLAEHANEMHYAFAEMSSFEHAIRTAREMTDPSETLILVTSDHGHALTIAGYLMANRSIFENDIVQGDKLLPSMFFATGPGYRGGFSKELIIDDWRAVNYMQPSAVFEEYGRHGGEDVGIWADGPFAELFSGTMENTNVAYIMKYLLCLGKRYHSICDAKEHQSPLDDLLGFVATMDPKEILSLLMALMVFVIFGAVVIIVLIVLVARSSQSRDIYELPITSPPSSLDST